MRATLISSVSGILLWAMLASISHADSPPSRVHADSNSSLAFVARHEALIIADDARLLSAMQLLRLDGYVRQSIAIAEVARTQRDVPANVLYELALAYFTLGDCVRAEPLFGEVAASNEAVADGLRRDSQALRLGCRQHRQIGFDWQVESQLGYDSNLANTRDENQIIPETGSDLDNVLAGIIENLIIADNFTIPGNFTLGTPKVAGWFVENSVSASLSRRGETRRFTSDLHAFYRHTQPLGYDSKGAQLSLGWHRPAGRNGSAILDYRVTAGELVQGRGRHDTSLTQTTAHLRQSLYLRPRAIHTIGIHAHAKNTYLPSLAQEFGGRINVIAKATRTRVPWQIGVYATRRIGASRFNTARITGLDFATRVSGAQFGFGVRREHLAVARPWRVHPHAITHFYGRFAYYLPIGESADPNISAVADGESKVSVQVEWNRSFSPDAHDRQQDWQVSLHYHWH